MSESSSLSREVLDDVDDERSFEPIRNEVNDERTRLDSPP